MCSNRMFRMIVRKNDLTHDPSIFLQQLSHWIPVAVALAAAATADSAHIRFVTIIAATEPQ